MSERGRELAANISRQLDEIGAFFSTLNEADLRRACTPTIVVGEVAAQIAEGYHRLGHFLREASSDPTSPADNRSITHRHPGSIHGERPSVADLSSLVERLLSGKAAIALVADLTGPQLERVPAKGTTMFSNGRRSLAQVIEAAISHQSARLTLLKRAVA